MPSAGFDAYAPPEIAARVEAFCVVKANLAWLPLAMLGVLAGAFIGLGAAMFTLVASDTSLGFAATRLVGGLAFSLGLVFRGVLCNVLVCMAAAGACWQPGGRQHPGGPRVLRDLRA